MVMPPQKRTPIDIWRKQEVIRWIDNEGGGVPTRAVKHFRALGWSIDGGAVRKWWRARREILAADPKTRRLPGAGRKKAAAAAAAAAVLPGANSSADSADHEDEGRPLAGADESEPMAAAATVAATTGGGFQLEVSAMETDEGEASKGGDASPQPTTESEAVKQQPPEPEQPSEQPMEQTKEQQEQQVGDAPGTPTIAPLTPSERAVQLLQRRYSSKLSDEDVVEAFDVMLDPMKARIFLVMAPGEQRDLWLLRQVAARRSSSSSSSSSSATASATNSVV